MDRPSDGSRGRQHPAEASLAGVAGVISGPEDSELVTACRGGDTRAFETLVGRYRRPVYRIARGILKNHEQADEAAQDAFLKAHLGLPGFMGGSSFKTWMYRIAINAAFDLLGRETTQRRAREQAMRETGGEPELAREPSAVASLIQAEDLARLREAIAMLPERQRLTLELKVREDLKYTEIAEVLG